MEPTEQLELTTHWKFERTRLIGAQLNRQKDINYFCLSSRANALGIDFQCLRSRAFILL